MKFDPNLSLKFKDLLKTAKNVLILTHKSPDPDAMGSMLALYGILIQNFKNLTPYMCVEKGQLATANNFKWSTKVHYGIDCAYNLVKDNNIDLVILLDANDFYRAIGSNLDESEKTKRFMQLIKTRHIKTVIIDHHPEKPITQPALWINWGLSSASETIYTIFVEHLGITINKDIAKSIMFGILGDTGRFLYKNPELRHTFNVAVNLVELGADIEQITQLMTQLTQNAIRVLTHMLQNFTILDNFVYSFITDEFLQELKTKYSLDASMYSDYYHNFIAQFLRSVKGRSWGFTVVPDFSEKHIYHVSFRSVAGIVDVQNIAKALGGGGHKAASAARVNAKDINKAIKKVLEVVDKANNRK